MKKIFIATLTLLIAFAGFFFPEKAPAPVKAAESRQDVLKVCNWEDYIDEDLISEFEEYYREKTGNLNFRV